MPQLQYVYFCIQILEATFLAILAHFTFILFTSLLDQRPKGSSEKQLCAFFQRKVPPAPSWSVVNEKPPTFLLERGKSFNILAAENVADILTRPTETNLLLKSSQFFFSHQILFNSYAIYSIQLSLIIRGTNSSDS